MANTLGYYNPNFYAAEALILLWEQLGMAPRVYMGYDRERRRFRKGEYINIRKPSKFTAATAPASTVQDLDTESLQIRLNQWFEVRFKLTDAELAYTQEDIIREHITPAANALAVKIDSDLCGLYNQVGGVVAVGSPADQTDVINARKALLNQKAPIGDSDNLFLMVNPTVEAELLDIAAFTQWQGAGAVGTQSQLSGWLGKRYGFNIFVNQNVATHTAGATTAAGETITLDSATVTKGLTTITLDGFSSNTVDLAVGDSFIFDAYPNEPYSITTAVSNVTTTNQSVTINPGLRRTYAGAQGGTFSTTAGTQSMAFHRNAFAIAFAELSPLGDGAGAQIGVARDSITGLTVRSRFWYDGENSAFYVGLDVLYGVKCLDPDLAVRLRD